MSQMSKHSERLRELMAKVGIASYRALALEAGISRWQIEQLRAGKGAQMRLMVLSRLASVLRISLGSLLSAFELIPEDEALNVEPAPAPDESSLAAVQQEYARLQAQLEERVALGRSQLKTEALQTLESWLVQWPTIAKRAAGNENLQAVKVLPFVRPVEQLMEDWGVRAIAPVDAEVDYDPQLHQLIGGTANAGEKVRVTHSGSLYEDSLLHRAKVKSL